MGSRCPKMECSGQACTRLATSRRPRSSLHSTKRSGASAWSLCWTLAGARRTTLWVVVNLINLIVSADGQCRRWLQENYESQEEPAGARIKRTETVGRNPRQIAILGVIRESIRHSPSDCREKRQRSKGLLDFWFFRFYSKQKTKN